MPCSDKTAGVWLEIHLCYRAGPPQWPSLQYSTTLGSAITGVRYVSILFRLMACRMLVTGHPINATLCNTRLAARRREYLCMLYVV